MSLSALIVAVRRARWVRDELPSQERRLSRNIDKVDDLERQLDGSLSAEGELIRWQAEVDDAARQVILLTEEVTAARPSFLAADEVAELMAEIPNLVAEDARQLSFFIEDAALSAQAKAAYSQNFCSRFSW
jgi:hypothetical protein